MNFLERKRDPSPVFLEKRERESEKINKEERREDVNHAPSFFSRAQKTLRGGGTWKTRDKRTRAPSSELAKKFARRKQERRTTKEKKNDAKGNDSEGKRKEAAKKKEKRTRTISAC